MSQENIPARPDPATLVGDDYRVPYETLVKLGKGDAAAGRRLLRTLIDVEVTHEPRRGPATKPDTVRLATEADEPALMELLRMDYQESAAMVAPFDYGHARGFIQAATRDGDARIGVIDGPDGPVGLIWLLLESWWFSADWYVAERLLFVHPDHRRSRHGRDLLQFAHWFVDSMSSQMGRPVYLISSVVGTEDVDRKVALFGRMMTRGGAIFIYPPPKAPL